MWSIFYFLALLRIYGAVLKWRIKSMLMYVIYSVSCAPANTIHAEVLHNYINCSAFKIKEFQIASWEQLTQ